MAKRETLSSLQARTGTLSEPSKMPCYAYSTPASACPTGSKLRKIPGSVCSICFACKNFYVFPVVQRAMDTRLNSLASPTWTDDMVELIGRKERSGFFRWHDSGDVQGPDHWEAIKEIARRLPDIKFWLPTKERWVWNDAAMDCPPNLTVRLSASMIGQAILGNDRLTSSVSSGIGHKCPATYRHKETDGKCGDCRACWDQTVQNIDYLDH